MPFKRKNVIGISGRAYKDELDVFLAELSMIGAGEDTIVDSL